MARCETYVSSKRSDRQDLVEIMKRIFIGFAALILTSMLLSPVVAGLTTVTNSDTFSSVVSSGFTANGVTSMTSSSTASSRMVSGTASPEMVYSVNVGPNAGSGLPYALGTFSTGFSVSSLSGNLTAVKQVLYTDSLFANGKAKFSKSYTYKGL